MHSHQSCKAGLLTTRSVAEQGTQGAGITGTQGIDVETPMVETVADAAVGLASELHIPTGDVFFFGMLSLTVAQGAPVSRLYFTSS